MKIGILSDIHGNHYALNAVLAAAARDKVNRLLILGDFVGYYYHPEKVLAALSSWDFEFIKGNHEELLGKMLLGEVNKDRVKEKYGNGHRMAEEKLSEKQISMLVSAPTSKKITLDNVSFSLNHGTPFDQNYYLYPDSDTDVFKKCDENVDFVLIGHSHYSFNYRNEISTLINVGSVGQSRSIGGIAAWCIINTNNRSFEMKATPYDTSFLQREVSILDGDIPYLKDILNRNSIEK